MVNFPVLLPQAEWNFSVILLWEPGQLPGGKTHKSVGALSDWASLEFLILRIVYNETPAICQLQFGFPALTLFPQRFLLVGFSSSNL